MATWHVGTQNRESASPGSTTGDDEPSGRQHAVLDDHPSLTACGLPVGLFVEFRTVAFDREDAERCDRCDAALTAGSPAS